MSRGKLYLAGPMSGIEDYNHPLFNRVAKLLRDADWEIVNPAEFEPEVDPDLSQSQRLAIYLRDDISFLSQCDGIVLLPGWANSPGANCEVLVTQILGLTSYVWEDEKARKEPHLYANLDIIIDHLNAVNFPGEDE